MSKLKKIILTILISTIIISGIVLSLVMIKKKNQESKISSVYAVSEIGYEPYGYDYESMLSGSVAVNLEQRVYISSSQKVDEILIKEGDNVKAGDVLLVFDTTSQNLQLEIERTELEIARVAIITAEQELEKLKKTTPVEPTTEAPTTEAPTTEEPTTEAPTTEEPTTEEPTTEEPTTEEPTTEQDSTPSDAKPDVEEPTTEAPTTEEPKTEAPTTEEPTTEAPVSEEKNNEDEKITYTKKELEKAIKEKENEIKQLRIDYQLKQIAYEISVFQNANGEIYCNFDGVVKQIIDEDTAASENKPLIVISGSDGYIVETTIGELSLMTVRPGDKVNLYCYDNGTSYEGTITEISDFPTENGYNYSSKNESFYPMKIAITDADDLQQGYYMEITMDQSNSEEAGGITIPLAFVKNEGNQYYVYKEVDGRLKKTYVKTGKIFYGSEIEILEGITYDDYIAFPYVDNVEEGVKTEHKSSMELYGY